MPASDENTKILIQIAGDIGRTREATETLKENYSILTEDVKEIKDQLSKTVTTPECVEKHRQVSRTMEVVKGEIIAEIKKSGTGTSHPAVTHEMLKAASAPSVKEMADALEEKAEEKKEKRRKVIVTWLSIITAISGLIVGGVVGAYKIAVFANKLESTVSASTEEVKSELKKSKNNNSKIVYIKIPVPVNSDGDGILEPNLDPPYNPGTKNKKVPKRDK